MRPAETAARRTCDFHLFRGYAEAALFPFASKFARMSDDMAAQPRHLCDGSRRPRRRDPCGQSARGPTLGGAANGATITAVECAASTAAASGALAPGSRQPFGEWLTNPV